MDKRITARFYDVYKMHPNVPNLKDVLQDIFDMGEAADRQATLRGNVTARLERLEITADYVAGEFTRVQNTNYPSEVHQDRVGALPVDGPLGHGIAFLFRLADSLLAIQYEPRILAPSRINSYVVDLRPNAVYDFQVRMSDDVWARMDQHPLRKLTIGIASPSDLANIENAGSSVADSFRLMGEAYEAPSITVELSMGHRKGSLGDIAKGAARQIHNLFQQDEVDLRKLGVTVETEEGMPNDEINLIEEILARKGELDFPNNDPERSYKLRRDWLIAQMPNHV